MTRIWIAYWFFVNGADPFCILSLYHDTIGFERDCSRDFVFSFELRELESFDFLGSMRCTIPTEMYVSFEMSRRSQLGRNDWPACLFRASWEFWFFFIHLTHCAIGFRIVEYDGPAIRFLLFSGLDCCCSGKLPSLTDLRLGGLVNAGNNSMEVYVWLRRLSVLCWQLLPSVKLMRVSIRFHITMHDTATYECFGVSLLVCLYSSFEILDLRGSMSGTIPTEM
jgi:hypothetical protein